MIILAPQQSIQPSKDIFIDLSSRMSDVEEVDNAEVEYTEGDDEFVNHQSVISADRASRMANMVSSGVIDPDSGNKVYFENKPALEVVQFLPEPEEKIEEQPQTIVQNEIEEPDNEEKSKQVEEKKEAIEINQKIQTLQTQLNQSNQANKLGDEILQDSHEMANQGDFKWNSGFNSKLSRQDSQNSHPSQQLQVIPSHKKSDIEQENPTFQKSHSLHQQNHKIEQLKPSRNEVADHQEVISERQAVPSSLVQQIVNQSLKKIEQNEKGQQRPLQIVDNNSLSAGSNIIEQQNHEQSIPVQIQQPQQRVIPNKQHQHSSQQYQQQAVNAEVEQKIEEHHVEKEVIHEAHASLHKQQQPISLHQNIRIKDNNLPSAVFSEEVPLPSEEISVHKQNKKQQTHHTKQNPHFDKQNLQITSSKAVHTYQQVQHQKVENKVTNQIPKTNQRPPSIKRQSMHINSVRQKPPAEQKMKKSSDNCSCEIM